MGRRDASSWLLLGGMVLGAGLGWSCDDQSPEPAGTLCYGPAEVLEDPAVDNILFTSGVCEELTTALPAGAERWTFEGGGGGIFDWEPIPAPDGGVFVAAGFPARGEHAVYRLGPDGQVRWEAREAVHASTPRLSLGPDGRLYERVREWQAPGCERLRVLDAERGTVRWTATGPSQDCLADVVARADGQVLVRSATTLRAYSPTGELSWSQPLHQAGISDLPLLIGGDGVTWYAFDGSESGLTLRALRDGAELWHWDAPLQGPGSRVDWAGVGLGGDLLLVGNPGLLVLDPAGQPRWERSFGDWNGDLARSPGRRVEVREDGYLLVDRSTDRGLLRLGPGGELLAQYSMPGLHVAFVEDFAGLPGAEVWLAGPLARSPQGNADRQVTAGAVARSRADTENGSLLHPQVEVLTAGQVDQLRPGENGTLVVHAEFQTPAQAAPVLYVLDRDGQLQWAWRDAPWQWAALSSGLVVWRTSSMDRIVAVGGPR